MKISPALRALTSQAAAFLLVASVLSPIFERMGWHVSFLELASIEGMFAALLSWNQERWWMLIQLVFAPMIVIFSAFQIDSRWFLLGFFLLSAIFWNAFRTRVPLFLTGREVGKAIAQRLPDGEFEFADLGSGLGGLLANLAVEKPEGRFFGVEIAPLPFLVGKARCLNLANCRMGWGSYERIDLSRFDFVYAFLSPVPMPGLFEKAKAEMKPGSVFVSNSFPVPGIEADERLEVGGKVLYFWKM